jgi:predicted RNase H-like nuclease (RuvC/YqgF family)
LEIILGTEDLQMEEEILVMSEREIDELKASMKELSNTITEFRLAFVRESTQRDASIEALQKSDDEQWRMIRALTKNVEDLNSKVLKAVYIVAGAVAIMTLLDLPSKVRALLMGI